MNISKSELQRMLRRAVLVTSALHVTSTQVEKKTIYRYKCICICILYDTPALDFASRNQSNQLQDRSYASQTPQSILDFEFCRWQCPDCSQFTIWGLLSR